MPISLQCPVCGTKLKASDQAAGKRVRCSRCKELIAVPVPRPPIPDFMAVPRADTDADSVALPTTATKAALPAYLSKPGPAAVRVPQGTPPAPIAVTCPSCGLHTEVPATAAGRTARCMRCHAVVSIPTREEEAEVEEGAPRRWLWWAAGGGTGVLILLPLAWLLGRWTAPPAVPGPKAAARTDEAKKREDDAAAQRQADEAAKAEEKRRAAEEERKQKEEAKRREKDRLDKLAREEEAKRREKDRLDALAREMAEREAKAFRDATSKSLGIGQLKVGDSGVPTFDAKVVQVIDKGHALIKLSQLVVSGTVMRVGGRLIDTRSDGTLTKLVILRHPTAGWVDGKEWSWNEWKGSVGIKALRVSDTKTYRTVDGGSKTVFVLEPFKEPAASAQPVDPAKASAAPGDSPFVGRWKLVNDKGVVSSYLTVTPTGAKRDHAPDHPGTWEVVGKEARLTWSDGFRDILRMEDGGKMTFLGLGRVTGAQTIRWDGPPTLRLQAVRISP
jgi:predicted Zn finger-like uncharacterized protein